MVGLWILFIFPAEETERKGIYIYIYISYTERIHLVGYSWIFGLIFGHASGYQLLLLDLFLCLLIAV